MKAFTGMNRTCCVSAEKVFQAGLALWPSAPQSAIRRPPNLRLPSARLQPPTRKLPQTQAPIIDFSIPSLRENYWRSQKTQNKGRRLGCDCELFPPAEGEWGARACLVPASCPPQTAE